MNRRQSFVVVAAIAYLMMFSGCAEEVHVEYVERPAVPKVFSDVSFQEALSSDKMVILVGTASWCIPCKKMCKTTWRDPNVKAWACQNAVAVLVDTDEQPQVKADYELEPIPNIVAIYQGNEIGRRVGYQSVEELMAWFDELEPQIN